MQGTTSVAQAIRCLSSSHILSWSQELTSREREIFNKLIDMGVDEENDPDLNELHKWVESKSNGWQMLAGFHACSS